MNDLFRMTELAVYRVLADCPRTFLKKGQEFPAFWIKCGYQEFVLMGISWFDARYLDFLLYHQFLERADM